MTETLTALQAKKVELERQIQDRGDIQVEKLADPMDISTAQAARDTAAGNINRASSVLRQVKDAIQRAKDGSYGVCVDCEEDIPEKRLNAVPWAARCIACTEAFDRDAEEPELLQKARQVLENRENKRHELNWEWGKS